MPATFTYPATVAEYRLVGYETRMLNREDFDNDKVDAGDVGSGQTVTALYEIVPVGGPRAIGNLRYSRPLARPCSSSVPWSSPTVHRCSESQIKTQAATAKWDQRPMSPRMRGRRHWTYVQ